MKAKSLFLTLLMILGLTGFAQAQTSIDELVKDWERARAYTKEYLEAMPESGYALKPTPEMRSFAQQMLHLTDANYGFAAAATGQKSPIGFGESEKITDQSKENVTKLVLASYDFVINSLTKMTPAQLNQKIKLFDQFEMTKDTALDKLFEHQTHHRGQLQSTYVLQELLHHRKSCSKQVGVAVQNNCLEFIVQMWWVRAFASSAMATENKECCLRQQDLSHLHIYLKCLAMCRINLKETS